MKVKDLGIEILYKYSGKPSEFNQGIDAILNTPLPEANTVAEIDREKLVTIFHNESLCADHVIDEILESNIIKWK